MISAASGWIRRPAQTPLAGLVISFCSSGAIQVANVVGTCLALSAVQSVFLVGLAAAIFPAIFGHYPGGTLGSAYIFLIYIPVDLVTISFMGILNGLHRYLWFHTLRVLLTASSAI